MMTGVPTLAMKSATGTLERKPLLRSCGRTVFPTISYTQWAVARINQFIEGGSLMFLARFDSHSVLTMGSMNFIERELEGLTPDILLAGIKRQ